LGRWSSKQGRIAFLCLRNLRVRAASVLGSAGASHSTQALSGRVGSVAVLQRIELWRSWQCLFLWVCVPNSMKLRPGVGNARESKRPRRGSPSWSTLQERHLWLRWDGRTPSQNRIAEIVVIFVFRCLFGTHDKVAFLRWSHPRDRTLLISGGFAVESSTETFLSMLGQSRS
jgi:hypothetical protein